MRAGIKSVPIPQIRSWTEENGLPSYRAGQILSWVYAGAGSWDEMTNVPKELRGRLAGDFDLNEARVLEVLSSSDGTEKLIYGLRDGERVEGVLMSYKYGHTVCVSTQAGCRMGCRFCASPPAGFTRGLTPGEIMDQVILAGKRCGGRVSNAVLMGIGEPLDNFDNVVTFLKNLSAPDGYAMSLRHVSLSTCGLADAIDRLADHGFGLTLSISLHAPDDELRGRLMPVNGKYGIERLMASADRYARITGRRVCYEYALIDSVNDSPRQAVQLAKLMAGRQAHINLIRCNSVPGTGFFPPQEAAVQRFLHILQSRGISATVRRALGEDLNASCGQLRRSAQESAGKAERRGAAASGGAGGEEDGCK